MFTVEQRVRNNDRRAGARCYPWSRIRRDYKPETAGYYILHEGMLGVLDGTAAGADLRQGQDRGRQERRRGLEADTTGGWAGITDKYWLTALIPDQSDR